MSRKSRVTADITLEAHNLLRELTEKHERSKGWLLDRMIRKYCEQPAEAAQESKAPRSKPKAYPKNLDEQFELLWEAKGKKGAKNGTRGAYNIFKKLAEGATEETCETFTKTLIDDINKNRHEMGYPEMHLTTYLNSERWDK